MTVQSLSNEAQLLSDLRVGNEAAFTALYYHYSPGLYVVVQGMIKDEAATTDIIQEIFSAIWKNRKEIQIANFAGYLVRAGQNRVINYFRQLQHDKEKLDQFRQHVEVQYSHIEEALHYQDSKEMLDELLDRLPPQQAKVYRLCRIDGLTNREVAEQLGISIYTVKEYLKEANRKIRTSLGNDPGKVLLLLLFFNVVTKN
ncbi:RNA polymerase sigma-70 factor, ECF subfamily [Chitinophaga jiangningensis]|uniref:RNA polymerase sigma-70 factor, ECF subfamily n=1 Tax=Chitinophaga jiangningensis TaxID=1419482 RepID=A0A1M6YZP1_9BACT|nr:RNA polymerase sigma-70 factor [Chitinophaga jiangningensis]SHL23716.1 RNA polymerase sigma-70 factor, ECF subfamily [Chitinophaga jiangningensis]